MAAPLPPLSPDYIAEYSGQKLIGVSVAFLPLIIIFVALRLYARHLAKAPWGLDDYLVGVSLIVQIVLHILGIYE